MSEHGEVALGPDNHLDIPGNLNFRDAGGWVRADGAQMRLGKLYRSDDPIRTTAEGRRRVQALGLSAVIDVRQNAQFYRGPGLDRKSTRLNSSHT